MKNTELSYFLESLQGQSLLDLSPAPGGGITLHFESKCTSGHTDDLTYAQQRPHSLKESL